MHIDDTLNFEQIVNMYIITSIIIFMLQYYNYMLQLIKDNKIFHGVNKLFSLVMPLGICLVRLFHPRHS